MFNSRCMICRDVNRFENEVRNLDNINRVLSRSLGVAKVPMREVELLSSFDALTKRGLNELKYHKPSVRLMCGGGCHKVNRNSLDISFNQFYKNYIKLIYVLDNTQNKDEFNKLKFNTLRCLAGHMPRFYNHLDRIKFKEATISKEEK